MFENKDYPLCSKCGFPLAFYKEKKIHLAFRETTDGKSIFYFPDLISEITGRPITRPVQEEDYYYSSLSRCPRCESKNCNHRSSGTLKINCCNRG